MCPLDDLANLGFFLSASLVLPDRSWPGGHSLGGLFIAIGLAADAAYALAGGAIADWLHRRPYLDRRRRLVSGITYIGLGITAASSGRT